MLLISFSIMVILCLSSQSRFSGEIVEINTDLEGAPESVNKDPYGKGWMIKVKLTNPAEVDALMDAAAYAAIL